MTTINPANTESSSRFYRSIWRWHFYAGLFVIPFMVMLAITGSIYLFKPQLDAVMYRDLMFVPPETAALSYNQQLAAAQQAFPDAIASKFTPAVAPDRSAEVEVTTEDDRTLTVFVNPYTAQVLGNRDEDNNFQAIVRKIHGELMLGTVGDRLVELASCWALVLLLSGLYLWWPRDRNSIWGTLLPRFNSGRRTFWRDLHSVPGFYALLLIGFLILTGLPWSGFWGEQFAKAWNHFPQYVYDGAPESTPLTGSLNQKGSQSVPWAVEQMPMPRSILVQHSHEAAPADAPAQPAIDLDRVIAFAQSELSAEYSVSLPTDLRGVYTIASVPNNVYRERTIHLDQYSGEVLADVGWADYNLVSKSVEMGVAIHMGKYGLANQLIMLTTCIAIVLLSFTGIVLWWMRRPKGRLGAPSLPPHQAAWKVPLAIVAVMGLLFPLVGFSLVIVLMLDFLVIARLPKLKRLIS
ncbi:PepSY domain-containing protein [Microcoleus sp. FACHB-1515]|uniref:PepSY-associated TM helix domain-containing protein n=1 Tax=Cyanophyceae TaxID=3028117 RepID=UPI00168256A6|nr:PepSY domain-containing protein [Microcoleus sp. FACHB-1515]MBD2090021.1 PepSY domain-containing protein [Microcoleus sp. FACHB-1515]